MPASSSWVPYVPQGVKGFDDDDNGESLNPYMLGVKFDTGSGCARWERTNLALNVGMWKFLF